MSKLETKLFIDSIKDVFMELAIKFIVMLVDNKISNEECVEFGEKIGKKMTTNGNKYFKSWESVETISQIKVAYVLAGIKKGVDSDDKK